MRTADILLIEDDLRLAELTARYFENNGFVVAVEMRGDRAIKSYSDYRPSLILLDLMLPGEDGLSLCKKFRSIFSGPILILTAKDSDIDQVIALEAGADDYVTKPVDPIVLLARTRALLRRCDSTASLQSQSTEPVGEHRFGSLYIDERSRKVLLDEREVSLTTQEFELLLFLAVNAGEVQSRARLYHGTRGINYNGIDRAIDGRISQLRRKLNDTGPAPCRIKTVWGRGYLFVPDAW